MRFSCCYTPNAIVSTYQEPQFNNDYGGSAKLLTQDEIMKLQTQAEQVAYDSHDNYAMNALFVNIDEKPIPQLCTIINNDRKTWRNTTTSSVPSDLPPGCLLRIGPNGATVEEGFLDGDGMIHAITIPPIKDPGRQPMYSCTYVETNGRKLEKENLENLPSHYEYLKENIYGGKDDYELD